MPARVIKAGVRAGFARNVPAAMRALLASAVLVWMCTGALAQASRGLPGESSPPRLALGPAPESAAGGAVPRAAVGAAPPPSNPVPAPAASPLPAGGAAAAPGLPNSSPAGPPRGPQAVREFLGLGPPPDAAAAKRGAPIFAANCAFCHGPQARGAEGPSLIYSELVLKDEHGAVIAGFLENGRPEKGMPAFSTLSDEQRKDLAEFLHQQVEDVANRGTFEIKNIVLGNPRKGASYVTAHCLGCHSVTGDLKGLAAKWRPADLQRNWIMPPRTGAHRAITATVHDSQHAWSGRVQQIDDFRIALMDQADQLVVVERNAGVTVELHDPLAPHVAMVGNLNDADMINVTAYLEALK